MSEAYKCDRCKKFFSYSKSSADDRINVHLCDSCFEEFGNFLGGADVLYDFEYTPLLVGDSVSDVIDSESMSKIWNEAKEKHIV